MNYINLTAGLVWLPELKDYRFCYLRSTYLEQKEYDRFIYPKRAGRPLP